MKAPYYPIYPLYCSRECVIVVGSVYILGFPFKEPGFHGIHFCSYLWVWNIYESINVWMSPCWCKGAEKRAAHAILDKGLPKPMGIRREWGWHNSSTFQIIVPKVVKVVYAKDECDVIDLYCIHSLTHNFMICTVHWCICLHIHTTLKNVGQLTQYFDNIHFAWCQELDDWSFSCCQTNTSECFPNRLKVERKFGPGGSFPVMRIFRVWLVSRCF